MERVSPLPYKDATERRRRRTFNKNSTEGESHGRFLCSILAMRVIQVRLLIQHRLRACEGRCRQVWRTIGGDRVNVKSLELRCTAFLHSSSIPRLTKLFGWTVCACTRVEFVVIYHGALACIALYYDMSRLLTGLSVSTLVNPDFSILFCLRYPVYHIGNLFHSSPCYCRCESPNRHNDGSIIH
jgi:hypothetical protein